MELHGFIHVRDKLDHVPKLCLHLCFLRTLVLRVLRHRATEPAWAVVRILLAARDERLGSPVMLKTSLYEIASLCLFAVFAFPPLSAQQPPISAPTIRVQSSLVL